MALQQLHHRSGRTTAFIYLVVGLALLLYVFWQSYHMLTHPVPGLVLPHPAAAGATAPQVDFGRMGAAAISFVLKLLVLLVMTIVASLCTWVDLPSGTPPVLPTPPIYNWEYTGYYQVVAVYNGVSSQPVAIGAGSRAGNAPDGSCGPQ